MPAIFFFDYQGGPDAVNKYIHSLGIRECAIVGTETAMHEDLNLCYENWTTPLAAAELVEIFRKAIVSQRVQRLHISNNGGMSNRTRPSGCSVARQKK